MKKSFAVKAVLFAAMVFGASGSVIAQDISKENPYEMVQSVATLTFDRIKKEQSNIGTDPEVLRLIVKEELLPYVDYKFSAYKVLGKYVRDIERPKLQEFVVVFREYLVTTYAVAMGYYDNQTVEFEPSPNLGDRRDATVRAIIKDPVRPDIKIAFKVRKDRKTNDWKAYDMVAEGISLLSSKQSEFEGILRKDGIDTVISLMRDKIDKPIELEASSEEN